MPGPRAGGGSPFLKTRLSASASTHGLGFAVGKHAFRRSTSAPSTSIAAGWYGLLTVQGLSMRANEFTAIVDEKIVLVPYR
jgi:hypothetical protein